MTHYVSVFSDDGQDVTTLRKHADSALGNSLQLIVVAEGVETETQLEFLRSYGCDEAQGFLYGAPVPAADFATLMHQRTLFPRNIKN